MVISVYSLGFWPRNLPAFARRATGTSQLKYLPWASVVHGGHSWKQQRSFKDKPHDDDDDDDDDKTVNVWFTCLTPVTGEWRQCTVAKLQRCTVQDLPECPSCPPQNWRQLPVPQSINRSQSLYTGMLCRHRSQPFGIYESFAKITSASFSICFLL